MSLVRLGLGLDSSLRKDQVSSLKKTSPNKYFCPNQQNGLRTHKQTVPNVETDLTK